MKYNIGQVLTTNTDINTTSFFGDDPKVIKAGTKMYVTADKDIPQALLPNGCKMRLEKDSIVDGFSVTGIASWIYRYLRSQLPIDEMLSDYDETADVFIGEIEDALEELGMWDNTGNRS
jgi:hypothetical protein